MSDRKALIEARARAMCAEDDGNWVARDFNETPSGEDPEDMRAGYIQQATAALSAIEASGAVVVPREATESAIEAAWDDFDWGPGGYFDAPKGSASPKEVYAMLIAASPFAKETSNANK
jgi:hypothetical protein